MKKILVVGFSVLFLFVFATESKAASCSVNAGTGKVIVNISINNPSRAKYPISDVTGFSIKVSGVDSDEAEYTSTQNGNLSGSEFLVGSNYVFPMNIVLDISDVANYRTDKPSDCSVLSENEDITYNVDAVYTGALKSTGRRTSSTPAPTTEVLGANETTIAPATEPVVEPVVTLAPVAVVETPAPTPVTEVLGEEFFRFNTDLRFGMQNDDVAELQKRLQKEGFFKFDKITGVFGSITKQAVMDYQKAKGIPYITGFCGPLTRAELNK